jgi:hypothetical protein
MALPSVYVDTAARIDYLRRLVHTRRLLDEPFVYAHFALSFGYSSLRLDGVDFDPFRAALRTFYDQRIAAVNAALVLAGVDTQGVVNRPPASVTVTPTAGSWSVESGVNILHAFATRDGALATLSSSDPDGDAVTYQLVNETTGRFFVVGNRLYGVNPLYPAADYHVFTGQSVTVRATDSFGLALDLSFRVFGLVSPVDVMVSGGSITTSSFAANNLRMHVVDTSVVGGGIVVSLPTLAPQDSGLLYLVDRAAASTSSPLAVPGTTRGLSIRDGADIAAVAPRYAVYKIATEPVLGVATWKIVVAGLFDVATGIRIPPLNATAYAPDAFNGNLPPGALAPRIVAVSNGATGVLATFSVSDPNPSDTHVVSLLSDPSGKFEIVGNQLRLRGGQALSHAVTPEYAINVRVTDALSAYADFIVLVKHQEI